MNDCKLVLDLLEEALTPAEKEIVNKYIDQYGKSVGIAVLIADLLRGRSRFGQQRADMFSTLFDELISAALDTLRSNLAPSRGGVKPSSAEILHGGERLVVLTQPGEGAVNRQSDGAYDPPSGMGGGQKAVVRKEDGEKPFVTIIDPKDYGEGGEQ